MPFFSRQSPFFPQLHSDDLCLQPPFVPPNRTFFDHPIVKAHGAHRGDSHPGGLYVPFFSPSPRVIGPRFFFSTATMDLAPSRTSTLTGIRSFRKAAWDGRHFRTKTFFPFQLWERRFFSPGLFSYPQWPWRFRQSARSKDLTFFWALVPPLSFRIRDRYCPHPSPILVSRSLRAMSFGLGFSLPALMSLQQPDALCPL